VYVCVDDLEDELIRAVGTTAIEALFDAQGDLASFRSFRNQPAWRGRELDAQMRRFLGSGARRKLRYAQLLARAAAERDALPPPLDALLTAVRPFQDLVSDPGQRPPDFLGVEHREAITPRDRITGRAHRSDLLPRLTGRSLKDVYVQDHTGSYHRCWQLCTQPTNM